ncbi:MAG TPA: hypothetical protein VF671_03475 [Pseudomonas sp.]|jgi:hypothetical protein|uniref:hypothetical protein n=1 Tax=Pseudomonas sp. TaxID=306 RepID=UPI002ED9C84F
MKKLITFIFVLSLTACTQYAPPSRRDSASIMESGPVVVAHLTERYYNKASNCGVASKPAFLCSGILIKSTKYSDQYHSWNPNPASSAVSFSYLRADSKSNRLAFDYNNGFIFRPLDFLQPGQIFPEVLCFFPYEAATDYRDQQGCGQSTEVGAPSRECQSQGIVNAQQWIAHFNATPGNPYFRQCGFNVRDALNEGATTAFNEGITAMNLLGTTAFNLYNEVRIAKWNQDIGQQLPLEAFFYLTETGKTTAQYNQRDFLQQTGLSAPIIFIRLPTAPTQEATFQFLPADQVIPIGG